MKIFLKSLIASTFLTGISSAWANDPSSVITVPTVTAMVARGVALTVQSPTVYALNRATAGDGGGGTFTWTAPTSAPGGACTTNTGTVFAASGVSTSSGCWVRQNISTLNVDWFGTTTDSSGDNTAAFQAAFNLCSSSHSSLIFPAKHYYFRTTGVTVPVSCPYHGAGPTGNVDAVFNGQTILDWSFSTTVQTPWYMVGSISAGSVLPSVDFGGFTLIGSATVTTGISVDRIEYAHMHDIRVTQVDGPCIGWNNTQQSSWANIVVDNCGSASTGEIEIDGATGGVTHQGTTLALYNVNADNTGSHAAQACIKIDRYVEITLYHPVFESCGIFLMAASKAEDTYPVSALTIINPDFEAPTDHGMEFGYGTCSGLTGNCVQGVRLLGGSISVGASIAATVKIKNTNTFVADSTIISTGTTGTAFLIEGTNEAIALGPFVNDVTGGGTYVKVGGVTQTDANPLSRWTLQGDIAPTSCTGRLTGTIWNNAGTLAICP